MPIIKPYEGLSRDRLTNLINSDNNTSLVEGVDFTYSTLTIQSGPNGRNTAVNVIPVDDTTFQPSTVRFYRLNISVLSLLPEGEINLVDVPDLPFTTHDILANINLSLGLNLVEEEVENITYDEVRSEYPLTIVQGSFAWLPSTYYFKVRSESMLLAENDEPLLLENGFPFELESA